VQLRGTDAFPSLKLGNERNCAGKDAVVPRKAGLMPALPGRASLMGYGIATSVVVIWPGRTSTARRA